MKWFISTNENKTGPLTSEEIYALIENHQADSNSLVWTKGFREWEPIGKHFRIEVDKSPNNQPTSSVQDKTETTIAAFLKGHLSLTVSFWVIGFVGSLALLIFYTIYNTVKFVNIFDPLYNFLFYTIFWVTLALWVTFISIGIWRSAASRKNSFAGLSARFVVVFVLIFSFSSFYNYGDREIKETWDIAFNDDPNIPDPILRIMRNGTEVELSGGIKYGLADKLNTLLKASPQIRVIHLNSTGGRIGEAERIAELIRKNNLITYTSSSCLSACTVAFAAGKERYLNFKGKLGYHSGSFAGRDYSTGMKNALSSANLPDWFSEKATNVSSKEMWYPTTEELTKAGAITSRVDNYRFAISGYGEKPTATDFAERLRQNSFFSAFETLSPDKFNNLVAKLRTGYIDGRPEGLIFDEIRNIEIIPTLKIRLAKINNDLSAEYAALLLEQYVALRQIDPRLCYQYAAKSSDGISQYFSQSLLEKELTLNEKALRTPTLQNPSTNPAPQTISEKIFLILGRKYKSSDLQIIASETVSAKDYGLYCNISISMFEEILKLPKAEIGIIIRNIFSDQ